MFLSQTLKSNGTRCSSVDAGLSQLHRVVGEEESNIQWKYRDILCGNILATLLL